MIVREVRRGRLPVLAVYRGTGPIYRRDNGVALLEGTWTYNGMTVACRSGVFTIDGTATGNAFMRLSHSYAQGGSNTAMADPNYVIAPAGKTTTLSAELLAGSHTGVEDDFNIVLRDSANAAAVNLKFSGGMRTVTTAHAKAAAVFCLYFRSGFTARGLVVMPTIRYV